MYVCIFVTRLAKINHESAKNIANFSSLLYHNLMTIHTNITKCLLLMQNLMGFLLQFTEMGYQDHN